MIATATAKLTAAGALPELDETDSDGLGLALPDALALDVGSTVGRGGVEMEGSGSPSVGDVPTSTTRTDGTARTGATTGPMLDDAEAELLGEGTTGPTVTVTTGPGAPTAAGANSGRNSTTTASSANPAAPTADR